MKAGPRPQHSHSHRIEAPKQIPCSDLEDDELGDKSARIACPSSAGAILLHFVDSFRKFVNFDIPALTKSDPDYDEFGRDPKVPLLNFVEEIVTKTQCEFLVLPAAIVLLKRMIGLYPNLVISINNMHRIMTVMMMLAGKFIEDVPAGNQIFATCTHFRVQDLMELELEFLALLNFDPFISLDDIESVLNSWGFKIERKPLHQ
jgi:hypothetical protein